MVNCRFCPILSAMPMTMTKTCYQTVFHDPTKLASVAAPTASLHFDETYYRIQVQRHQYRLCHRMSAQAHFAPSRQRIFCAIKCTQNMPSCPQATADLINQNQSPWRARIAVGTTVTSGIRNGVSKPPILKPDAIGLVR